MPASTPATAFAAVVRVLAPNADEAQHMVDHGGKAAVTVGKAVLAALKAGKDDSEAGCKTFLAALAAAAVPARDLARHGNSRQQQVSKALLAAQAGATAVDWHVKPVLGRVTIAAGPGDVRAVAGQPTKVSVALRRDGDLAAAASARWRFTGLGPSALSDVAVFPIGGTASVAAVTVPGWAGMADPVPFGFEILGGPSDLVGLTLGEPHAAAGRLLPPVVVPTRSVVSVAQGFDAVVLSADAPTTATVVLARAGGADALEVPVVVTGLQDGDLAAPAQFASGADTAGALLQFAPGTAGAADRAARLDIDASGGAFDLGAPAGFSFTVREPAVAVPPAGPKPLDPASYANQAQADPSSFSRVTNGLRPGTAVLLAPGHYGFTSIHVPGCLYYAAVPGTVCVDGRVELHTPDTAILLLDVGGGIVLDGPGARASRCVTHGSDGVDLVSVQGEDCVLDWCEIFDFAGIGVGVQAKSARRPVMFGLHVHSQRSSGPPASGTVFMIGHSHIDSDQPVQGRYERILIEGSRSHDGFEIKSSDNTVTDVTAIGADVMQRHGIRAATFLSCWAEAQGGQGGRIQLNSNNPKAVRCHGHLAIAAGNGSVEDLLHKSGGNSIYPYANGAEGHHHDGPVEIGNLHSASRPLPPLGTRLDACPTVKVTAGTYAAATPIPPDTLPPPPRRLTPADVGPGASRAVA